MWKYSSASSWLFNKCILLYRLFDNVKAIMFLIPYTSGFWCTDTCNKRCHSRHYYQQSALYSFGFLRHCACLKISCQRPVCVFHIIVLRADHLLENSWIGIPHFLSPLYIYDSRLFTIQFRKRRFISPFSYISDVLFSCGTSLVTNIPSLSPVIFWRVVYCLFTFIISIRRWWSL